MMVTERYHTLDSSVVNFMLQLVTVNITFEIIRLNVNENVAVELFSVTLFNFHFHIKITVPGSQIGDPRSDLFASQIPTLFVALSTVMARAVHRMYVHIDLCTLINLSALSVHSLSVYFLHI